jgi:hypothetical protein
MSSLLLQMGPPQREFVVDVCGHLIALAETSTERFGNL